MTHNFRNAVTAFRAGRLAEAERAVRAELSENPRAAAAWNLLGAIASAAGHPEAATQSMQNAVTLAPREPSFRCNLARALLATGDIGAAERVLTEARRNAPDDADVLELWGLVRGRQGHEEEMIASLIRCCELAPGRAGTRFNLGEVYRRQGRLVEAAAELREAIEIDPVHADALNNLSGVYLDLGDYLAAIRCIESLLALRPQSSQAYCNLGAALRAVGDIDQAIASLRTAVHLDPQAKSPRFQLANLLVATGKVAEGELLIDELREATPDDAQLVATKVRVLERRGSIDEASALLDELAPEHLKDPAVALATAFVREQQEQVDEAIEALEDVLAARPELVQGGWSGCFRLGKLYDRSGRYDEAFAQITMANKGRAAAVPEACMSEMSPALFDQWKSSWSAAAFARMPSSSLTTASPIFIIGMPRTGSSLIEQILASHPEVHGCGEIDAFGRSLRKVLDENQRLEGPAGSVEETPGTALRQGRAIPAEQLDAVGNEYLREVLELAANTPRHTDKMPYNYRDAGWIRKVFPAAVIIHCRRHPLDTCLSCYFQDFLQGHEYTSDLQSLARYYNGYLQIMAQWQIAGVEMHAVKYEELIADPKATIQRLLDACGLARNRSCLDFHASTRAVGTASYQQIRKPMYNTSVGRWKHYAAHLDKLIAELDIDINSYDAM